MTAPGSVPGFGRLFARDDRDRRYLMRAVDPFKEPLVGRWVYRRGPILNQGSTGTCVGHAWRAWVSGEPIRTSRGPTPFEIYDRCIAIDEWPENDRDVERRLGTSVRAGARVLTELGHARSYVWAYSADEVARWLLTGNGGVVIGIDWYSGMSEPSHEGIIRATGRPIGGHACYVFGIDAVAGLAYVQNSWGESWGGWPHPINRRRSYAGCALLPLDDLDRLLRDYGEACAAVEQRVAPSGVQ